jgi:hypothetical protein
MATVTTLDLPLYLSRSYPVSILAARARAQNRDAPASVSILARAKRRIGRRNPPMSNEVQRISSLASTDAEYRFGRAKQYLAPHELARLTILRSKLGDSPAERAAERTQ